MGNNDKAEGISPTKMQMFQWLVILAWGFLGLYIKDNYPTRVEVTEMRKTLEGRVVSVSKELLDADRGTHVVMEKYNERIAGISLDLAGLNKDLQAHVALHEFLNREMAELKTSIERLNARLNQYPINLLTPAE